MEIKAVDETNRKYAYGLLAENRLPVNDITSDTLLFFAGSPEEMTGVIGIEILDKAALLRSLCVSGSARKHGIGAKLVGELERTAKERGVVDIYLLTETADKWFERQGYSYTTRSEAETYIGNSAQFRSTCPASAVIMHKKL